MGAGLEVPTGKVPGTVVRATPAPRPPIVGAMILGLLVCQLVLVGLVGMALWDTLTSEGTPEDPGSNSAAGHDPHIPKFEFDIPPGPDAVLPPFTTVQFFTSEQTIISFWIAGIFFSLSYMVFLYQRFFKDHVTIAKKRFRKWEDEGVQLHD